MKTTQEVDTLTQISRGYAVAVLVIGFVMAVVLLAPVDAMARDDDRDRVRFYGWVESIPDGLHGTWIIGGRRVTTDSRTEFDQLEGPLVIGGCAKVDIRNGFVHEIDSEPPEDCR